MITSRELRKLIYEVVNVTSVTSLIDGDIWDLKMPIDSKLENIVINNLPISSRANQNAVVNVNAYIPLLGNGMPNSDKIEAVTKAMSLVLDKDYTNTGKFFQFEVVNQSDFQDPQFKNYTVSNFRLECWVENDTTRTEV